MNKPEFKAQLRAKRLRTQQKRHMALLAMLTGAAVVLCSAAHYFG